MKQIRREKIKNEKCKSARNTKKYRNSSKKLDEFISRHQQIDNRAPLHVQVRNGPLSTNQRCPTDSLFQKPPPAPDSLPRWPSMKTHGRRSTRGTASNGSGESDMEK